jgi:hypothetical protein
VGVQEVLPCAIVVGFHRRKMNDPRRWGKWKNGPSGDNEWIMNRPIRHAECFELSEYGRRPEPGELDVLLPA